MQRQQREQQQTPRGRLVRSREMTTATPQTLKPYVLGDFGVQGTQQVLQQVSHQKKSQQNVRPICPITNEIIPKGRLYVADCLHAFDIRAITEWVVLQKHLTCPLCRRRTVGFPLPLTNQNYVGNRHINKSTVTKGGWVAHTAIVSPDATVGFHCKVADNAKIQGHATLKDHAVVMEDAIVKNKALIEGRSIIADHACVTDEAVVKGESIITGHAIVGGHATVNNSVIARRTRIGGASTIIDTMVLRRDDTMME